MRHQQRENVRLKLVVSDEDDVFGRDNVPLPTEFVSCPSSCASLSVCYMNEAAFDDDADDADSMHSDREEPDAASLNSPDIIAGMRRALQQECASYEDITQPSAELDHKELDQETWVCSHAAFLQIWYISLIVMSAANILFRNRWRNLAIAYRSCVSGSAQVLHSCTTDNLMLCVS